MRATTRSFTLVEIMVVIVILFIGIVPIYQAMVAQSQQTRFSRRAAFAASVTNNLIEIYRPLAITALVEAREDGTLQDAVDINASEPDPMLFPWHNPEVQQYLADNPESSFGTLLEAYEKEMANYELTLRVESPVDDFANVYCTIQAVVSYDVQATGGGERRLHVPAFMLLTNASFPSGTM